MSVRSGTEHGSFSIDWYQKKDAFDISLFGPLGVGIASINGDAASATLMVPGDPPLVASDADDLLHRGLGLDLPVGPMQFWVRGVPAPGTHTKTRGGMKQMGWTIEYLDFAGDLPRRIRLTRPEAKITLVVTQWQN